MGKELAEDDQKLTRMPNETLLRIRGWQPGWVVQK